MWRNVSSMGDSKRLHLPENLNLTWITRQLLISIHRVEEPDSCLLSGWAVFLKYLFTANDSSSSRGTDNEALGFDVFANLSNHKRTLVSIPVMNCWRIGPTNSCCHKQPNPAWSNTPYWYSRGRFMVGSP